MQTSSSDELRALLRVIAEQAESLRAAGVQRVDIAGVASFTVAAPGGGNVNVDVDEAELISQRNYADPLEDPATYGGRRMPSFARFRPDFDPGEQ